MRQRNSVADLLRPDIQKELGITGEQRQKLDDIRFNSEKESIQHRSALQILRLELSRLTDAENPDRAAIDKKIQEVAQEEGALMRSSINTRLNARAVLTAEQRSKLAQLMRNRPKEQGMPAAGGAPPRQAGPNAGPARKRMPLPAAPEKPQAQ
jgi:Spy/CpxP family protein refolding chaperone